MSFAFTCYLLPLQNRTRNAGVRRNPETEMPHSSAPATSHGPTLAASDALNSADNAGAPAGDKGPPPKIA